MAIYIVTFFVLALMSFIELFCKKDTAIMKTVAMLFFIFAVVVSGIRGGIRADYPTYKEVWDYMTHPESISAAGNFFYEPLYSILQLICKAIFNNFQIFIGILGIIVMSFQYSYAKSFKLFSGFKKKTKDGTYENVQVNAYAEDNLFYTILMILWGLYCCNIFTTRSSIALVICLWGTRFIEKKKFVKFLITVIIAIGFHYSAAIFLFAYFIFWFRSQLWIKLVILVGCSGILFFNIGNIANIFGNLVGGSLGTKISNYTAASGDLMYGTGIGGESAISTILRAVLNIGLLLIIAIFLWHNNKANPFYEGYMNLYFAGCILYISTLSIGYAFARLSIYYNVFQVPMLLYLFSNGEDYLENGRNNKLIIWIVMVVYLFARLYVNNRATPFAPFWIN